MRTAAQRLAAAGVSTPTLDAQFLLEAAAGLGRAAQIAEPERALTASEAAAFARLIARRAAREPVAHILGRKGFWTLELSVTPDVLAPRPETEHVVEAALAGLPADRPQTVLDLGTGSGALLLAVLSERALAWGVGVDHSAAALAVAARNARQAGLAARAEFVRADWDKGIGGRFDAVLANPPYIPTDAIAALSPETRADPMTALDGGPDGLVFYRRLAASLDGLLVSQGLAAVEIGAGQSAQVEALLRANANLVDIETRADLAGTGRVIVCRKR